MGPPFNCHWEKNCSIGPTSADHLILRLSKHTRRQLYKSRRRAGAITAIWCFPQGAGQDLKTTPLSEPTVRLFVVTAVDHMHSPNVIADSYHGNVSVASLTVSNVRHV